MDFFNVLTGPELLERTEALLPEHREREYPPTVALSMLLKQALEEDRSCQKAVNSWIAQCVAERLPPPSKNTGGYSKTRQRIPVEMVTALTHEMSGLLCSHAPTGWRWRGRTEKLVDGTGISMKDTEPGVVAMECPRNRTALDRGRNPPRGKVPKAINSGFFRDQFLGLSQPRKLVRSAGSFFTKHHVRAGGTYTSCSRTLTSGGKLHEE